MTLSLRTPVSLWLTLSLAACPEATTDTDKTDDTDTVGETDETDETDETEDDGFTVGGTVSGLDGDGLVLKLGGQELKINKNGSFTFKDALEDGDDYDVKVLTPPSCKAQTCRVSDGEGEIEGADVDEVRISCSEPKMRMYTANWGDNSVLITDDVLATPDEGTATPRVVKGRTTGFADFESDGIAVDVGRDLAYVVTSSEVLVFEAASTMEGDVAPVRTMVMDGSDGYYVGVELDEANDRLYVTNYEGVFVVANASTADGTVLPVAKSLAGQMSTITLDPVADILYVSGDYSNELYSFDGASTLTGVVTPTRTVIWGKDTGDVYGSPGLWVDACNDRLYIGSNQTAKDGTALYAIENASTFTGEVALTTSSVATMGGREAIALTGDGTDRLYVFEDSASSAWIYSDVSAWTGDQTETEYLDIGGVISRGYGIVVHPY